MDQLPRFGKRELICLLLFICNYVVSVWRGFFFLWVLGMGYIILLLHSLSLPYDYGPLVYKIMFEQPLGPGENDGQMAMDFHGQTTMIDHVLLNGTMANRGQPWSM